MKTKHAFYSEEAFKLYGCSIYERTDGGEVRVTYVCDHVDEVKDGCLWTDKVYMGVVKLPAVRVVSVKPRSEFPPMIDPNGKPVDINASGCRRVIVPTGLARTLGIAS